MIKCLKGHKSLGSLCSVVKTLIVSGNRPSKQPTKGQGHLLNCCGQLKRNDENGIGNNNWMFSLFTPLPLQMITEPSNTPFMWHLWADTKSNWRVNEFFWSEDEWGIFMRGVNARLICYKLAVIWKLGPTPKVIYNHHHHHYQTTRIQDQKLHPSLQSFEKLAQHQRP